MSAPSSSPVRAEHAASLRVVNAVLQNLAEADLDAWAALMADDAVLSTPYAPPPFKTELNGRAEWEPWCRSWFGDMFERFEFYDLDLRPALDPEFIYGTGRSRGVLRDGRAYNNDYAWIFQVRDGRLLRYTEYFNQLKVTQTFGDWSSIGSPP